MFETLVVALIVGVAAGYAVWALMPAPTRRNAAMRIAHGLGGPQSPGLRGKLAARFQKLALARAGGCSDCPAATATPAERAAKLRDGRR